MSQTILDKGLLEAQEKARQLLHEIEIRNLIKVGIKESELSEQIYQLAFDLFGTKKHWHKRVVRAGENSVFPYSENPPDRMLEENDLIYLDLGPVFEEFEGDIGKTYLLGKDTDKERLIADLEKIFATAKAFYLSQPNMTGAELWQKVLDLTKQAKWKFGNYHAGHIIGEFSHIQNYGRLPEHRIQAENNTPMDTLTPDGKKHHWILEIHLVHPDNLYGGFYEDLLTL